MATEEQKKKTSLRLVKMILLSLSTSIWNMMGDTAFSFSGPMGHKILDVMEKEYGLEIAGEDPQDIMMEMGRIFVDEVGLASDIDVSSQGEGHFEVRVRNCIHRDFTDELLAAGVEKPFVCPVMNACQSALRRQGFRMHESVEKWVEGNGSIITFDEI